MKFVENGPDIPPALLRAHQDGEVVFFCGAGISKDAGIPLFDELTERVFLQLSPTKTEEQKAALAAQSYDLALGLLEREYPEPHALNPTIWKVFNQCQKNNPDISLHTDILRLSRHRNPNTHQYDLRLVTTNWDRLFEKANEHLKYDSSVFIPPALPIPKPSQWNGLVYLHGLLTDSPDDSKRSILVATSADFGMAYLSEGWASSFVSSLFKSFTVCFVGYSLNDPILRYLTESLQASNKNGDDTVSEMFAFCGTKPEKREEEESSWHSKGVTPLWYCVQGTDHSSLHKTLHGWADLFSSGLSGKCKLVNTIAPLDPNVARSEGLDEKLLYALSDSSGIPAELFASISPPPQLGWLRIFESDFEYGTRDQVATLFSDRFENVSHIAFHIIGWLGKLVAAPHFFSWLFSHNTQIHWRFRLELLDCARTLSDSRLASVLRMFLAGKMILVEDFDSDCSHLFEPDAKPVDLTTVQVELARLFEPKLVFRPLHNEMPVIRNTDGDRPEPSLHFDVVLASRPSFSCVFDDSTELCKLPHLVSDALISTYERLIEDYLKLSQFAGGDLQCHWAEQSIPSISSHEQNEHCREWEILVFLLRECWNALSRKDPNAASRYIRHWIHHPSILFRRVALYGAAVTEHIPPAEWCSWLTHPESSLLWNPEAQREVGKLLKTANRLKIGDLDSLEAAIRTGPKGLIASSADMMNNPECFQLFARLVRLEQSGVGLSRDAVEMLCRCEAEFGWKKSQCLDVAEISGYTICRDGPLGRPLHIVKRAAIRKISSATPVHWMELLDWEEVDVDQLWRFRTDFLHASTPRRFARLGDKQKRYSRLLARYALANTKRLSYSELRGAISRLPIENGLLEVVGVLEGELHRTDRTIEDKWKGSIEPFLRNYWHFPRPPSIFAPTPSSRQTDGYAFACARHQRPEDIIRRLSEGLFKLCILAPRHFKETFDIVKHQFGPMLVNFDWMEKESIVTEFPETVLEFLIRTIPRQGLRPLRHRYQETVRKLVLANPKLKDDGRTAEIEERLGLLS